MSIVSHVRGRRALPNVKTRKIAIRSAGAVRLPRLRCAFTIPWAEGIAEPRLKADADELFPDVSLQLPYVGVRGAAGACAASKPPS